jgi:DNA-binding NtrC family response regulator
MGVARMSKSVLIIDYHSDIAEMLAYALSLEGYSVKIARKQSDEVKILQEDPAIGCLLLDARSWTMPYDGYIAALRQVRPDLPVILLSGTPEACDHARALGLKCCEVTDPFDLNAIHQALQESGTWAEVPQH